MVPPSGMSVSRAAFASASGVTPPCFWIARGSTSLSRIHMLLKPIETCGTQLRDQRGEIGRLDGEAFLQHDLHPVLLGFRLVGGGDAGAVRTVLIDDGHAQVLRRLLESVLRVGGDVLHGVGAEESA